MELDNRQTWNNFHEVAADLRKMVKNVERAHLVRLQSYQEVKKQRDYQRDIFLEMGWTQHVDAEMPQHATQEAICECCGKTFQSQAALATHQQRKHHQRIALRRVVTDGVCRACGKMFHTRVRLLGHLHRGQSKCWVSHLRCYKPMSEEQTNELDYEDKQKGMAFHQRGSVKEHPDKSWRWAAESEMFSSARSLQL